MMIMSNQEQKQNLIEHQRQIQHEAKLQAQRTVMSGLMTAPHSASVPVTSSLVIMRCNFQVLHQVMMLKEKNWRLTLALWVNMLHSHHLQFMRVTSCILCF